MLIAEGGVPKLVKAAYLDDADCGRIAEYAATIRTLATDPADDLPAAS